MALEVVQYLGVGVTELDGSGFIRARLTLAHSVPVGDVVYCVFWTALTPTLVDSKGNTYLGGFSVLTTALAPGDTITLTYSFSTDHTTVGRNLFFAYHIHGTDINDGHAVEVPSPGENWADTDYEVEYNTWQPREYIAFALCIGQNESWQTAFCPTEPPPSDPVMAVNDDPAGFWTLGHASGVNHVDFISGGGTALIQRKAAIAYRYARFYGPRNLRMVGLPNAPYRAFAGVCGSPGAPDEERIIGVTFKLFLGKLGGSISHDRHPLVGEHYAIQAINSAFGNAFYPRFYQDFFGPAIRASDTISPNPLTLESTIRGSQKLRCDRNGAIWLLYASGTSSYEMFMKRSEDAGGTWTVPITVATGYILGTFAWSNRLFKTVDYMVAMLYKESDKKWYMSIGTIPDGATDPVFTTPVKAFDVVAEPVNGELLQRSDGTWEFGYMRIDGVPSFQLRQCVNLDIEAGTGTWT